MKKTIFCIIFKFNTQFFKSDDMGIQSSAANLIATRFGNKCFFKSCQHRSCNHDGATQSAAFFSIGFAVQVIDIYIICLENTGIPVQGRSIFTPISPSNSISRFTSRISGILVIVIFSGVSKTALMICNASFFAPCGMISPFKFFSSCYFK